MHEQREMTTVQVKVNKWDPLEGTKQGERYTIRLPKQILHESTPYSQANYHEPEEPTVEGEDDGESKLNPKEIERRKAETLLHQVEHTIRWRWVQGPDGTMIKKSNTRLIRWSDGSLSLQLGPPSNLFDISSSSTSSTTSHNPNHLPTTYIVAHHQEAELLQSEGPITSKLTLVPANLKGDMHQKLAKSVKGRNEKGSRLKI
ncbi:Leo1-like protein [Mrakia frigida]|uniref:RNA polymerase-associated LEO1 family protein n=1 Tax=Mrakia frigida TaxID=29902 RepID=UPI003FCC19A8